MNLKHMKRYSMSELLNTVQATVICKGEMNILSHRCFTRCSASKANILKIAIEMGKQIQSTARSDAN